MRSAGLSKEEILKIAKEKAQDIIDISIEEKEEFFELQLNTRCDFYPKHELRHAIHKINYGVDRNEKLEKTIADNMRKEIEDTVANFNIEFTDSLIVKLNLEDRYRQRYSDNNILYKVKRYYKEQGNVIYSRDLLLYYIEKFKSLIPSYEPLWRIIAYDVTLHENEEDMEEYMHSISERTRQLLFAYDTITDILRTGKTDNDIFFVFNFHLSHFISLVKSLGDNTGWLLNLYLKLKIDPYRIDLLDDYFRNRTSESHPRLAAYIYDNSQFLDFRKLNEYRDIVQHRHIIHSARVMVGKFDPKSEKIMIPKDPDYGERQCQSY